MSYSILVVDANKELILRQPTIDDTSFLRYYATSPELMESQGGTLTEKELQIFIDYVFSHWKSHGFGHYVIWMKGEQIGLISLKQLSTSAGNDFDLGFTIMPNYRGKGLATQASETMLDFAFNIVRLDKVTAMTLNGNPAAERVLKKLGFSTKSSTTLNYMGKVFNDVLLWEITSQNRMSLH